jgi:Lrp/AsnC family transcriptional regulator for asnA, asnC and gidA
MSGKTAENMFDLLTFLPPNYSLKSKAMLNLLLSISYEVEMVDELDLKLMQELQKNGREAYVALAKMLGVVEGTVRKRVKKLLDKNTIKIVAVPNPRALGYSFLSIMGLQVRMADLRKVAENLAQKPNVCYLAFVTGRYDLMAIIMTRSPEELSQFIEKEISALPSILRTETFVNLDIIKGGWPGLDTAQLIDNIDLLSVQEVQRNTVSARS